MKKLRYYFFLILMLISTLQCGSYAQNINKVLQLTFPKISVDYSKFNLSEVELKYGDLIKTISKNSGLTLNTIYSFLIVENQKFNQNAISSADAIGLMQVKKGTANDVIIMAYQNNMLSTFDEMKLKSLIGNKRLLRLKNAPCLGRNHSITAEELSNPELNLVVGCIFLKILAKESNNNIEKMGIRYLNGYFAFNSGKNISSERLAKSHYVNKLNNIHKSITYYA